MGKDDQKTAIIKSAALLRNDLVWYLFCGKENRCSCAERLSDAFFQLKPIDPAVEFLVEGLDFDPNVDPLENPYLQLLTKQLLTISQNGARSGA